MKANAYIPACAAEAERLRRQYPGCAARTFRDLFWLRACFWSCLDRLNGSCGCFLGYRWDRRDRRVDPAKPAVVVMMPADWTGQHPEIALGGPGLMLFAPANPWDGQPLWCWTDALVISKQPKLPGSERRWIDDQPTRGAKLLSAESIVGQLDGTLACAWEEAGQRLALTSAHVGGAVGTEINPTRPPAEVWGRVVKSLPVSADETLAGYLGGALAGICPQMVRRGVRFELDAALLEVTAAGLQPENAVIGQPGFRPRWPAAGLAPATPLADLIGQPVAGVGAQSGPRAGELIGLSVQFKDPEDDPDKPPVFSDYLIKPAAHTDFGVDGDSGKLVYTEADGRALGLYGGLGNFTAEFGPAAERWRRANDLGRIFRALGRPGPGNATSPSPHPFP